jgi:hypothetical protein
MPLAVWIGVLLSLATAGVGLIIQRFVGWPRWSMLTTKWYRSRRHHHLAEPTIYDDAD